MWKIFVFKTMLCTNFDTYYKMYLYNPNANCTHNNHKDIADNKWNSFQSKKLKVIIYSLPQIRTGNPFVLIRIVGHKICKSFSIYYRILVNFANSKREKLMV